jgi:O-methyltransferase involved in polyketide biosynthesis
LRASLQGAGIPVPESLTFAPIDFETQTLSGGLGRAGFKADEPAFFSMLGVVVYLTRDAAMGTLKFVASLPSGTEIVFDYAISPSGLAESDRIRLDEVTRQGLQRDHRDHRGGR